jgi:hypothetical protein
MKQTNSGNGKNHGAGNKKRRDSDARKSNVSMTSSFMSASSKMLSGMKLGFRNRATSRSSDLTPDTSPASSPARARPTSKGKKQQGPVSTSTTEEKDTKPTESPMTPSPSPPQVSTIRSQSTSSNESSQHSPPPQSAPQVVPTNSPSPSPQTLPTSESVDNEESDPIPEGNPEDDLPSPGYKEKIVSSPSNGGHSPMAGGLSTKNQEYFKKMREV